MISIVDELGVTRYLGNIEQPLRTTWAIYGDKPDQQPMFDESEWPQLLKHFTEGPDHPWLPPVANQENVGMCNASATCTAVEFRRSMQGQEHVELSGGDLYHRICGGRDRGSLLEDGLREAMSRGIASTKTCPYVQWQRESQEAAAERKYYRVLEAVLCPTPKHCMSAVFAGYSLITGIMWYENYTPDASGWLPRGGGQAGGHAIFGYKPTRLTSSGTTYGIWHQNSWTMRYGLHGRFVIPLAAYAGPVGGWWAVRSVTQEQGGVPPLVA